MNSVYRWFQRTAFSDFSRYCGYQWSKSIQAVKCFFGKHDNVHLQRYVYFGIPEEPWWCMTCNRKWPSTLEERIREKQRQERQREA